MSAINYEKGIHRHWMNLVSSEDNQNPEMIIRKIQDNFDSGVITEAELINWGREFEKFPHALIETLLYFGVDFD